MRSFSVENVFRILLPLEQTFSTFWIDKIQFFHVPIRELIERVTLALPAIDPAIDPVHGASYYTIHDV